jgi:hypothetical protein
MCQDASFRQYQDEMSLHQLIRELPPPTSTGRLNGPLTPPAQVQGRAAPLSPLPPSPAAPTWCSLRNLCPILLRGRQRSIPAHPETRVDSEPAEPGGATHSLVNSRCPTRRSGTAQRTLKSPRLAYPGFLRLRGNSSQGMPTVGFRDLTFRFPVADSRFPILDSRFAACLPLLTGARLLGLFTHDAVCLVLKTTKG